MTQSQPPGGPGWSRLIGAPTEVIRHLKGQHLLLVAMGAAVLIALIGLFGPVSGQPYAWLLAGVVLVLSLLWALLARRGGAAVSGRGRNAPEASAPAASRGPGSDNEIDVRSLKMRDARLSARRGNRIRSKRRAVIEGLDMSAGVSQPPAAKSPRSPESEV